MRPRSASAGVVAMAAALVVLLQLPGPAACPNLAWRFAGLALDTLEADPPDERSAEPANDADAVVPSRHVGARRSGHSETVVTAAPPHIRPDAAVDAGVTRAPPAA